MKRKVLLASVLTICSSMVFGQRPTIELTFTAIDSAGWIQLDSIKVMNRTQEGDTMLYNPDSVLVLDYTVGMPEIGPETGNLQVSQNYPNPMNGETTISIYVPDKDRVCMIVSDVLGREIIRSEVTLEKGQHFFRLTPGSGNLFFFSARWRKNSSSIKILQTTSISDRKSSLDYLGSKPVSIQSKSSGNIESFAFNLGDNLLYIGYINNQESGMLDAPETNETYTFQFATNIPCPGIPTVEYEGQVYNTIQIFSQCWLKENLNVGQFMLGEHHMTDNGIIDKYCYADLESNCVTYGGLYEWDEIMQYNYQPGGQGICPPGWHIPTDEEWRVLEGVVDSQYGIEDSEWDLVDQCRGYDAEPNLKSNYGWANEGYGTDLFGFTGLPGGCLRASDRDFVNLYVVGGWWSSTKWGDWKKYDRFLRAYWGGGVCRFRDVKNTGLSVRCIRDE